MQYDMIVYTGYGSIDDFENTGLLLNLQSDGTYTSEIIRHGKSEETFTGSGRFIVRRKNLHLIPQDSLEIPVTYIIDSNKLVPSDTSGIQLMRSDNGILERHWRLVELNGKPIDTTGNHEREAHIVFKALNNRVFGSGGCNRFSGSYELQGDQLNISQLISTKMACMNIPYENEFFKVLQDADKIELSADTLLLLINNKPQARFIRNNSSRKW